MKLCQCGCGKEVKYLYVRGHNTKGKKHLEETKKKMLKIKQGEKNPLFGKNHSEETKKKMSESMKNKKPWNKGKKNCFSVETIKQMISSHQYQVSWNKFTIEKLKIKHSFFSRIEEMRYNPDKLNKKEIQVHCKNRCCENSKEKSGWFTPSYIQIYERIRQLEKEKGNDGMFFYCSDHCELPFAKAIWLRVDFWSNSGLDSLLIH
jgi:hypothetical protein